MSDQPLEERITRQARRWFPVAVGVLTVVAGMLFGPGFGVLVLAAGAFIGAISAMWNSVRSLFGETPLTGEDAFAIGAPSAEEEQKRAVLRAIKDVEFERSVGKITEEDYQALIVKYRAEAKRLLRILDERAAPERERVEKLVQEHLAAQGLGHGATPPPAPEPKAAPRKKRKKKAAPAPKADARVECPSCNVLNESDALFCKSCASPLEALAEEA